MNTFETAPSISVLRLGWFYCLYCLFHLLTWPLLVVRALLRAKKRDYLRSLWRRLLGGSKPPKRARWIVLISPHIGETKVAARLSKTLRDAGERDTAVLATVDSAIAAVRQGEWIGAAPFNNPFSCLLFLARWRPKAVLAIGSCDIPHLCALLVLTRIPLVVVQTALSSSQAADALRNPMRRWRWLCARLYAVAEEATRRRLLTLGVCEESVFVSGPLGTWPQPRDPSSPSGASWRKLLGLGDTAGPVIVAGSTHEADEGLVLPAFSRFAAHRPEAVLVLAPRRLQRLRSITQRLEKEGLSFTLRSKAAEGPRDTKTILLDTYGELEEIYAIADVAFIGGTCDPTLGGHTPVEALSWGVPVTLGPHYEQQRAIVEPLLTRSVARVASTHEELVTAWLELSSEGAIRAKVRSTYEVLRGSEKEAFLSFWSRLDPYRSEEVPASAPV